MYSAGGQGFIVLRSRTHGGASRIVAQLHPGAVVTTIKNTVDKVVTEHGVAELRGRTLRQRAEALIAVADPDHRDGADRGGRCGWATCRRPLKYWPTERPSAP